MSHHILKCPQCQSYGLDPQCSCSGTRVSPKPAKFSPEDRYGHYRRLAKKNDLDNNDHQ